MTTKIGTHEAEGPFSIEDTDSLRRQPGVYVVFGNRDNLDGSVLDVGRSESISQRIDGYHREFCWRNQGYGQLWLAAIYAGVEDSKVIERELREKYDPPCGAT